MKYLVLTIRRPDFDSEVVPAHYDFLDDLRAQGLLVEAGPFTDKTGGAYVLRAGSVDEARRVAELDPLHIQHCSTVTVHEWDAK